MARQQSRSPIAQLKDEDKIYVAHDTITETIKTGSVGLGAGFVVAALQNALAKRNLGAMAVFTRGAPMMGVCAAAPASYVFVSRSISNLRESEDFWSSTAGGFVAGSIIGMQSRRMPVVMGFGALFGSVQGMMSLFGSRLDSFTSEDDAFESKEIKRRTTKIPVEQTLAEIGERRGIHPPGYEERRRQRIKDKYGFEINPVSATTEGSE